MDSIIWTCKYCLKDFSFHSKRQIGGHLTNCKENPKHSEIKAKAIRNSIKVNYVKRIDFIQICPRCSVSFNQILTESDIKNKSYKKFCDKVCANSTKLEDAIKLKNDRLKVADQLGNLSQEEKAKELRKTGISILDISRLVGFSKKKTSNIVKGIISSSNYFNGTFNTLVKATKSNKIRRIERDNSFIAEADKLFLEYKDDPLFMLGVGLYWGEGGKTGSSFVMVNSDPALLTIWMDWHKKFAKGMLINPTIYCHEDVVFDESKRFWSEKLRLNESEFHFVSCVPKSSKHKRPKRILPYGTLRLTTRTGSKEMFVKMMRWIELVSGKVINNAALV